MTKIPFGSKTGIQMMYTGVNEYISGKQKIPLRLLWQKVRFRK